MTIGPFTDEVIGYALAAQKKWRIPASLPLAAAVQESSLGKATPPNSLNWFGITAVGGRPSTSVSTREQNPDGTWYVRTAGFEVFPTVAAGFDRYGQILGLASPYHDAVTAYLHSAGTPDDVRVLTRAIAKHWATALVYGDDLVAIQDKWNLYQLNLEPKMTDPAAPVPAPAEPTPPRVTPSVSQSIRVDWGSWVSQLLAHEAPIIEAGAQAGLSMALANVPMGGLILSFIGPTVVKQYLDQGLTALEGVLNNQSITVPASNTLEATIANLINTNEPELAKFLGSNLDALIKAAVAKLGLPT